MKLDEWTSDATDRQGIEPRLALFPVTTEVTPGAQLAIGGLGLEELAEQHGTPLYVYDAATLDAAVAAYRRGLARYPANSGLTYAGKAYLSLALAQWTQRHQLVLDCTGVGELALALAGGVPRQHILVHGVNKSEQALALALARAGTIVVDNLAEMARLAEIASAAAGEQPLPDLWLRLRPGETVTTHGHLQTGQHDSKFGMGAHELETAAALGRDAGLAVRGLHFHLGSQFRDWEPMAAALERALESAAGLALGTAWVLCPGGGLGVASHEQDLPHPDPAAYAAAVAERVVAGCASYGLPLPHLQLEPGRSLVARAGVAIYRVGSVKEGPSRRWLLLDGGMADNPRHALYGARYSALPVRDPLRPASGPATFAGPFCESGDVLIEGLPFAAVTGGELVAVPMSGAYQLSMASNYNGALRPAVLWLEGGHAALIQAREEEAALLARERPLPGKRAASRWVTLHKYQANGNDYLVARLDELGERPDAATIRALCDRHRGPGSDGLLVDCSTAAGLRLRIFNPDGGEAEKSGNGLAIFTRYLWDRARLGPEPATIETAGGTVQTRIEEGGTQVAVVVGKATVAAESLTVEGIPLQACTVNLGNPHTVVLYDGVDEALVRRWGPLLEQRVPDRTNVEFVTVQDRANLAVQIWERGAGYTLASGTGSAAAAAATNALGLCAGEVTVHTPGGSVAAKVDEEGVVTLRVPVMAVWSGRARVGTDRDVRSSRPLPE